MASAMDSTIPPTIPTSLAASFSVTMMSSTASFMSWAASAMASWVWEAWVTDAQLNKTVQRFFRWLAKQHMRRLLHLWVSSTLLGSIQHLQRGLSHGFRLVQESHLLLVVIQLGRHAHRSHDQRFKVASQLGHLRETVKGLNEFCTNSSIHQSQREPHYQTENNSWKNPSNKWMRVTLLPV